MSQQITARLQNIVYNSLFDLLGTTSTGYGAQLISDPVSLGQPVKANDWNLMIQDVERCLIHQTGTSTNALTYTNSGTLTYSGIAERMYTQIQLLQARQGTAHPSQLRSFTYNSTATSPVEWTCTNYSNTVTMKAGQGYITAANWSWFYPNQLNYFFNLGGSIQPHIKLPDNETMDNRSAWQPLIDTANNIKFGHAEFLQVQSTASNSYQVIVTGNGNKPQIRRNLEKLGINVYHTSTTIITTTNTTSYSANAIVITFINTGTNANNRNQIVGSLNFVAGLGPKSKSKSKTGQVITKKYDVKHHVTGVTITDIFTKTIIGRYLSLNVKLETDFLTTYPAGTNGGLSAQVPQTQITSNSVSAAPSPIPQFTCGTGDSTLPQIVTLRNNSTLTCTVSNIVLSGYTDGVVSPTTMTIAPGSSSDFVVTYTGIQAGHYQGMIDVLCNINRLTLFTEINVGSTNPRMLTINTTTIAPISKNFVVDHAGGYFKNFDVEFPTVPGFTYTSLVTGTNDTFNITFNPIDLPNGLHVTTATVTVNPLDSSQIATTWTVPVAITTDVVNRQIAQWVSALGYGDVKTGISYDIIDGTTYLTIGIGPNNPNMNQLGVRSLSFASWQEVYRFPILERPQSMYSKDYVVKKNSAFVYNSYFGVGTAAGSVLRVINDGLGNITVRLNSIAFNGNTIEQRRTLDSILRSFYYYDANRTDQLQNIEDLLEEDETYYLTGIDASGNILTSLVPPLG
jgi:hypothetical protein